MFGLGGEREREIMRGIYGLLLLLWKCLRIMSLEIADFKKRREERAKTVGR